MMEEIKVRSAITNLFFGVSKNRGGLQNPICFLSRDFLGCPSLSHEKNSLIRPATSCGGGGVALGGAALDSHDSY